MKNTFTLNELKVAVINRDLEKLKSIAYKEPSYSSVKEAQEILSYIEMAKEILKEEKLKTFKEMQEIKKLKEYYSKKEGNFNLSG